MPKLTKQERIIRLLTAMGYKQSQSRSSKYLKFSLDGKPHIWVGQKGALRSGATLGHSIVMTQHLPALFKKYNI